MCHQLTNRRFGDAQPSGQFRRSGASAQICHESAVRDPDTLHPVAVQDAGDPRGDRRIDLTHPVGEEPLWLAWVP
jgi:hypothetical protein